MKYLIVDDNPKMRKIIAQIICTEQDIFLECSDGKDTTDVYAEYSPDYVLMDIKMKNMNGILSAKKICEKFPAAKIIIVTDYDTPAFREAARKAGAFAFVPKENLENIRSYI